MNVANYDVAIIGAGFTGSALAIQLTRRLAPGARVLVLGSPEATGRGLAYGTAVAAHLLNVRADRMSIFPDDPEHFVRWLERADAEKSSWFEDVSDRYVPRSLYGRYVRDTLDRAIAEGRSCVRVDVIEGTAVEIGLRGHGFVVRAASGERCAASAVALCLGHGPPTLPLKSEAVAVAARDHVIADPWSDYRMRMIAVDDRVLFIGTGLTMIDQALTLAGAGHVGTLTAISRHGHLPAPHPQTRTEARTIDLPAGDLPLRRLARLVIAAARAELDAGGDWRAVVDGLRPISQRLWQGLDAADRWRFIRHIEAVWSVHRHRMAPSVAKRIAALGDSGRLSVQAARIVAIKKAAQGITVALRRRGSQTIELSPFDWVINCSGTGKRRAKDEPLLGQLITLGLATPDPLGRGIEVTPEAGAIGGSGRPTPGLFALGPLSAGRFLEITAVPDIREQCAAVAAELARFTSGDRRQPVVPIRHEAGRIRLIS